jgi:hypothetical protein
VSNTCKTCRWWGESVPRDLMEEFSGMRLCTCPKPGMYGVDHDRMEDPRNGDVATNPDFGCVLHEERPSE